MKKLLTVVCFLDKEIPKNSWVFHVTRMYGIRS